LAIYNTVLKFALHKVGVCHIYPRLCYVLSMDSAPRISLVLITGNQSSTEFYSTFARILSLLPRQYTVRFEVTPVVSIKITVFWERRPFTLVQT